MLIAVYPNPTEDGVKLVINESDLENYSCDLYNAQARKLFSKSIEESFTFLDLSCFSPSTYYLKVMNNNKLIKSYKIIKK